MWMALACEKLQVAPIAGVWYLLLFLLTEHGCTEIALTGSVRSRSIIRTSKISTYPHDNYNTYILPLDLPPFLTGFTTAIPAPFNLPSSTSNTPLFRLPHSSLFAICSSMLRAAFRFCCLACFNRSMISLKPSSSKSPQSSYCSIGREEKNIRARCALSLCVLSG